MTVKIAVITDLHFANEPNRLIPQRCGEFADILLTRAVHRFNRFIKPDIVLIAGDLINDPSSSDAAEKTAQLYKIIKMLKMPFIVIPGNHDLKNPEFYNIFPKPQTFIDIGKLRLVTFDDPETPGFNARRDSIETMRAARAGWTGHLVALQHVPLNPPERCPFNYENAAELLDIMADCGYSLSISGHFHAGLPPLEYQGVTLVTAAATCEKPFPYQIIEIADDGKVSCQTETLALPASLKLTDSHIHTPLAYCNENMSLPKINRLAELFGLTQTVISEHSAHLYFDLESYQNYDYFNQGVAAQTKPSRIAEYFTLYRQNATDHNILGMEVDFDRHGNPVIDKNDWQQLKFRNGAIHHLASLTKDRVSPPEIDSEFLFLVEAALKSGIDVLVHPFRIFRRRNQPTPEKLFMPVVSLLKKYKTAVEINFHTNEPPPAFFKMCIDHGIKLTFGSDSHNLYEVGEFYPHLKLLEQIAPGIEPANLIMEIKK
ncbi:MAG: metallophosphoesterase [Victivallaceae bacterium]|nr:metallophosphoesterase [Victivallaceae bacterium]